MAGDIPLPLRPARVQKIERPTDDVAIIQLSLPAHQRPQFLPGHYLDVLIEGGERRSFSIANSPDRDGFVQLHIRHIAGGAFTETVFGKLKTQDILHFELRQSAFYLRGESSKPMVFVASGTGFAPIKAIIENAIADGTRRAMTLYWGGRRPRDLYLSELPRKWADENAGFRFVPVISEALPEDAWTGRPGLVHRAVVEDFPDLSGHQVYACGVPAMVKAARLDFTAECRLPENEFISQ